MTYTTLRYLIVFGLLLNALPDVNGANEALPSPPDLSSIPEGFSACGDTPVFGTCEPEHEPMSPPPVFQTTQWNQEESASLLDGQVFPTVNNEQDDENSPFLGASND